MTFPNSGTLDYIPDGAVFWVKVGQKDVPVRTDAGLFGDRIGEPFAVFDHLTGADVPSNSGTAKYIKLTAGEGGAGGFNEGLLINETTTGSGPTVEITAEIAVGPMSGEIVHLINSSRRFLRPGQSGVTQNDQNKLHGHPYLHNTQESGDADDFGGLMTNGDRTVQRPAYTGTPSLKPAGEAIGGDGGDESRPANIGATYYMRIV